MEQVKLNVRIPVEDHAQLKSKAALERKTLMEAVLEAIRLWIRKL